MAIIDYGDGIFRDTNVIGENVYLAEPGRGQGCDTIWFETVARARKFARRYGYIDGHAAGMCHQCKCHYSFNTKDWRNAPFDYACKDWKEKIKQVSTGELDEKQAL